MARTRKKQIKLGKQSRRAKEAQNRLRNHGSDIGRLRKLLKTCLAKGIKAPKEQGKVFGCLLSHVTNTQTKDKSGKADRARVRDLVQKLARELESHTVNL